MIDRIVDRVLDRTVRPGSWPVPPDVAAWHQRLTVVDLLVGTPLFRRTFLARLDHGHVDLPRARLGGLDVIGFTIATRFNDLRGSLSTPHFVALGLPRSILDDDLAIAEAFLDRIDGWVAASGGRLAWWDPMVGPDGLDARSPIRCFAGIQGGQVVAADLGRIERLAGRGVRMLGLAHVMDTPLAGSSTGRNAGGLTGLGREAVAEAERVDVLVDLAHASVPAIEDALRTARRPAVISHTGFTALAGTRSRWRRYSPATRNLPDGLVREAGAQGALIGVTFAASLIGGTSMTSVVRSLVHAVELVGPDQVAVGSDFDGALRMPFDVRGLPALTAALLEAGL
ncbi:MAG TPA: membrane dipeptidase, partial [Candidatus Saccharimonadia bacterium]|nr:membrane dipeptidase [Candidatus Saccharimonadia bacterium]